MSENPDAAERFDAFVKAQERMRPYEEAERARVRQHSADCFGRYGSCISCGCDRQGKAHDAPTPCVSHGDTQSYQNALLERIARALEVKP
jgi:hypothetical protein